MPQRLTTTAGRALEILKLPSVAFGIFALAVLWWGAFALIQTERSSNRREIENDTANLSRAFEQNVIRSLSEIDKTLLFLRRAHASSGGRAEWTTLFAQASSANDMTFQLGVIDAGGWLIASDRGPQPPLPIDLSDRDHFRVHAYLPGDTIYISKPVLGRVTKQWSVQITRRLTGPDSRFNGVIVASLDPEHFASFFRSIGLGTGGSITLVGLDGVVRASGGHKASLLGARLDAPELVERIRRQREATIHYREAPSDTDRIASVRWVEGYPLAVIVGTDEYQPVGSWKRDPAVYLATASVLSLLILAALGAIVRRSTRLAEARRQLRLTSLQHEVTLENMAQGILTVDAQGEIGFMNARFGELLGLPTEFTTERHSFAELVDLQERSGEFQRGVGADLLEFIRFPGRRELIPHYERKRPDGTVIEVTTKPLADGGFIRTFTDITERRRAEAKVLQLAQHDALTGLMNRAVFRQQLEEACRMIPAGRTFAVLMIDLDRFKPVNDTFGHAVGDLLLKVVAERLRDAVRGGDLIGRLGGDEFAIIQMGVRRSEQAVALAQRVCRSLCQPYSIDGQTIMIGASIGIAMSSQHGCGAQDLFYAADLALYSVKANARGTHAVFQEVMHEEQCARRKLEEDLRKAIERDEFTLHYQPIISIATGEVTAYEALIRWQHPERGNVPPLDFIPLAEETGLIGPIGAWVLKTACGDIASRQGNARIAINLSPVQFRDRNLVELVIEALDRSDLPASRLEIEITESALLADDQLTQHHLGALKELGVHITMDDFGTGYSSLSYLLSYPIQTLKIDRSFVMGLGTQANAMVIVKTIATLASSLGLSTTAEGVETEEQLAVLRDLGCTEAQGYYFSKPKPAAEILPPLAPARPQARSLRIAV